MLQTKKALARACGHIARGKKSPAQRRCGLPRAGEKRIASTKEDKLFRWNRNPGLHSNPLLGGFQEGKCKQSALVHCDAELVRDFTNLPF